MSGLPCGQNFSEGAEKIQADLEQPHSCELHSARAYLVKTNVGNSPDRINPNFLNIPQGKNQLPAPLNPSNDVVLQHRCRPMKSKRCSEAVRTLEWL
jgi:hypothetical protein